MLKGWKTFLFALAVSVFGALEAFDFTSFLDGQTAGIVTTIIGAVTMLLRYVTKTPMFSK